MFLPITTAWPPARKLDASPVNLAFDTFALRSLCESQLKADRELGTKVAARLRDRLADIRAADTVADLAAGRPREIEGGRPRCFSLELADGYHLVFCANHNRIPVNETGGVDWSRVTRIKILQIEVRHG